MHPVRLACGEDVAQMKGRYILHRGWSPDGGLKLGYGNCGWSLNEGRSILHSGWSPNGGQIHPISLVRMEPEWKTDTSCTVDGAQVLSRSIHGIDYWRLFHTEHPAAIPVM